MYNWQFLFFFFFNDTATTEIYTLSLHDALPIWPAPVIKIGPIVLTGGRVQFSDYFIQPLDGRSEEHTSELQSPDHLVCRLLLEKKKINSSSHHNESPNYNTPTTTSNLDHSVPPT